MNKDPDGTGTANTASSDDCKDPIFAAAGPT
jgi:hypothetical protein